MIFLGIDLGWWDRPTGVASLHLDNSALRLHHVDRVVGALEALRWVDQQTGDRQAIVSVDAPLIIENETGQRPVERCISKEFWRYEAGCHSSNKKLPFAPETTEFSAELRERGYLHGAVAEPRQPGRYQVEVYPHPAMVNLFGLEKTLKYKKGRVAQRAGELRRLRQLILDHLSASDPALAIDPSSLPTVPDGGTALKVVEDKLDALLSAYIGAYWWCWGTQRNTVYGDTASGYIIVPHPAQVWS